MNIPIITEVIKAVTGPIGDYVKRKQEIKAAEHAGELEITKARLERQAKLYSEGLAADASWEMEFARQAASSWKDEYTLIVVSIPAILCFIPGGDKYVTKGFEALNGTPSWYQFVFVTLYLATVGIRWWRRQQYDTE